MFVQKPDIIPPSQNRVAVLQEQNQIKDMKKSPLTLKHNSVKNSDIV